MRLRSGCLVPALARTGLRELDVQDAKLVTFIHHELRLIRLERRQHHAQPVRPGVHIHGLAARPIQHRAFIDEDACVFSARPVRRHSKAD
jgi:hypothetical protein